MASHFPLPFRLATLIVTAVWIWGAILRISTSLKIDVPHLIRPSLAAARPSDPQTAQLHQSIFRFAAALTTFLISQFVLFWTLTFSEFSNTLTAHLANLTLLITIGALVVPHRYFTHSGRSRLLHTAGRVAIGGLAKKEDGKFGDVLFADTLTSFAKPISEIYIVFCMIFTGQKATEGTDRSCGSWFWVPSLMCWPFFIRFIQCWGDHQVANAWKYATGIIAIILSAIQVDSTSGAEMDVLLHYLWILAVTINSAYSFYWDVTQDWDLTLFTSQRGESGHVYGLRGQTIFNRAWMYYVVIAIDLVLRCTWSLKLSVHLEQYWKIEGGIFVLEFLEIVRRGMWMIFRIEAEYFRAPVI